MIGDAEEQWIEGQLPAGRPFQVSDVTDLQELLPDCGYKLRYVDIVAEGELRQVPCDDCDTGTSTRLVVTGGGVELELEGDIEPRSGAVRLVGKVEPPFEGHQRIQVASIEPVAQ